ncbi:unnamed protein product, partial [Ixodes persulcatus]
VRGWFSSRHVGAAGSSPRRKRNGGFGPAGLVGVAVTVDRRLASQLLPQRRETPDLKQNKKGKKNYGRQVALKGARKNIAPVVLVVRDAGQCRVPGQAQKRHLDDGAAGTSQSAPPGHASLQVQLEPEGHGEGGEGGVPRHERQPHLLAQVVADAGLALEVLHVCVRVLAQLVEVGHLAEVEEVRAQPADGVLGDVRHQLTGGRPECEHPHHDVEHLQHGGHPPPQERAAARGDGLGDLGVASHHFQHHHLRGNDHRDERAEQIQHVGRDRRFTKRVHQRLVVAEETPLERSSGRKEDQDSWSGNVLTCSKADHMKSDRNHKVVSRSHDARFLGTTGNLKFYARLGPTRNGEVIDFILSLGSTSNFIDAGTCPSQKQPASITGLDRLIVAFLFSTSY